MKVALLGSAPSSVRKAPFGDASWLIWGCSPGLYPVCPRVDSWFELHRWEPPVVGKPDQQVPWFSPEYVQWMAQLRCPVWMQGAIPAIPGSQKLPWEDLCKKYGHFFFTSSLAWMAAMAIEAILVNRELVAAKDERSIPGPDAIGFWGVDMSATEEYGYQRAGCQFFATLAASMGIEIVVPPESDLMMPSPLYGICEGTSKHIKLMARRSELMQRKAQFEAQFESAKNGVLHMTGAIDDLNYHLGTWIHEGQVMGTEFEGIFATKKDAGGPPEQI